MTTPTYLLIDASNLIWASFFKALANEGIKPEQVPSGFSSHVHNFRDRIQKCLYNLNLNSFEMVFAIDERPLEKYEAYPEYKAGRKTQDLAFNPKPGSMKVIQEWRCLTIASPDREADDAIASFAKKYYTTDCIVLSTDKDLWQLCELPNVKVYNTFTHEIITESHLKKSFDDLDSFKLVSLYKTIFGDSSDNIKSLMPRFKKKIVPIINKTDGTLDSFKKEYENGKEDLSKTCKKLYETNKDKFALNDKLVSLNYNCELKVDSWPKM